MASTVEKLTHLFKIGYHRTNADGYIEYQDGYISASLTFIILFSFGLCLSFGQYITTFQTRNIHKHSVETAITVYMLIGILFMAIVTFTRVREMVVLKTKEDNVIQGTVKDKLFGVIKKILPLMGIIFFLLGVIGLDIMRIIPYSVCLSHYIHDGHNEELTTEAIVSIVYHLVRAVFTALITYFCCFFIYAGKTFKRTWVMRYGIMLLLATLFTIWADSQLYESKDMFELNERSPSVCRNITHDLHANLTVKCLCKETTSFQIFESYGDFLFPLNVEFCLLVSECLLHLFFTMKYDTATETQLKCCESRRDAVNAAKEFENITEQVRSNVQVETNGNSERRVNETEDPDQISVLEVVANPEERLINADTVSTNGEHEDNPSLSSEGLSLLPGPTRSESSHKQKLPFLFISILIGLVFLILSICNVTDMPDEHKQLANAYYAFKIVFWLIGIMLTFIGLNVVRNFKSKQMPYTGFQMLILISTIGFYMYIFFTIPAATAILMGTKRIDALSDEEDKSHLSARLVLTDVIFNGLQVYLQTLFMFHAVGIDVRS